MPFDNTQKLITAEAVLLMRAMEVIANPSSWCTGKEKREYWFRRMRYCAVGAMRQAIREYDLGCDEDHLMKLLNQTARTHGYENIEALNDHPATTHAQILAVYRDAIELAQVPRE